MEFGKRQWHNKHNELLPAPTCYTYLLRTCYGETGVMYFGTYRALCVNAPLYTFDSSPATLSSRLGLESRQTLRSSTTHSLSVPAVRLSTVGRRAFLVSGTQLKFIERTNLLSHIRSWTYSSSPSLLTFQRRLKCTYFMCNIPVLSFNCTNSMNCIYFAVFEVAVLTWVTNHLSIYVWRCALWLNDTSCNKCLNKWKESAQVPLRKHDFTTFNPLCPQTPYLINFQIPLTATFRYT